MKNKPYKVVFSDEPCDRTEGHEGIGAAFLRLYDEELAHWKIGASRFDGGDASFHIGYTQGFSPRLIRVEVIQACDGDEIREYGVTE